MIVLNTKPVESNETSMQPLAIGATATAKLLGVSVRHLWAMNSSGRLPRPVRFGRAVRWNLRELQEWMDMGSPPRDRWEKMKSQK